MNTIGITSECTLLWGKISWWWQFFSVGNKIFLSYSKRKENEKWGRITRLLWIPYHLMHLLFSPALVDISKTNCSSYRKGPNNFGNFNKYFRGISITTNSYAQKKSHFFYYYKWSGNTNDRCYNLHVHPFNPKFLKEKVQPLKQMATHMMNEVVKAEGKLLN